MVRDHLRAHVAKFPCTVRGEPKLASLLPVHNTTLNILDEIFYLNLINSFYILNTFSIGIETMMDTEMS